VVTRASLSGLPRDAPRLVIALRAGSDGRRITRLTMLLPNGLAVTGGSGVAARNGRAVLGAATPAKGRAVRIVLRSPTSGATVAIGPPQLNAAERLVRQSRSHMLSQLRLTLSVTQANGGIWNLSLPLT
jgi:hypothetical protein